MDVSSILAEQAQKLYVTSHRSLGPFKERWSH